MLTDLLKWGLPLFFASAVTVGGDGGGDGDAAVAEGGAGAEISTDDSGSEGTAGTDAAGVSESIGEAAEGEAEEISEGTESSTDGRAVPDQVKKALAKLRETDPKAAEIARRAYYEASDYKRVFPNVSAARDARDLIEAVGGEDGITNLRSEANEYAAELKAMGQGDPRVVDDLARDFPDALAPLISHGISKLQQSNPDMYLRSVAAPAASEILRLTAESLGGYSLIDALRRTEELIMDAKQPETLQFVKAMRKWASDVEALGKQRPANGTDPREKSIQEKEQALAQKEKAIFIGNASGRVKTLGTEAINRQLAPLLKGKTLTKQQRDDLSANIHTHLFDQFKTNQAYQDRMRDMIADGDVKGIERYVRGMLTPERVSKSVKAVWGLRGFSQPAKKAAAVNNNSVQRVTQKPASEQIDWSKDKSKMRFYGGEATLLPKFGGKVVRWTW